MRNLRVRRTGKSTDTKVTCREQKRPGN